MAGGQPFVQTIGVEELQRSLRAYDAKLPRRLRLVNIEAVNLVVEHEKALAPVGDDRTLRDGRPHVHLRDAIVARAQQRSASAELPLEGAKGAAHGGVINFGWPLRNIRPQEFMFRGANEALPEALALHELGMDELIAEVGL